MKRVFAFEDATPSGVVQPSVGEFSANASRAMSSLQRSVSSLTALESMGNYLRKTDATQLGRSGVLFANIAIEQECEKAQLALESLPLNPQTYQQDPAGAVNAGLAQLQATQQELLERIRASLSALLETLCWRREWCNARIGHLWRVVTRVDDVVGNLDPADFTNDRLKMTVWQGMEKLCYTRTVEQMDPRLYPLPGSQDHDLPVFSPMRVTGDLHLFLTEHEHLFKRIIAKQTGWLNDHKDNLLKNLDGFGSYLFNPVEYQCHGASRWDASALLFQGKPEDTEVAQMRAEDRLATYRSQELPGMKAFYTVTSHAPRGDLDGLETLCKSVARLGDYDFLRSSQMLTRYNAEPRQVRCITAAEAQAYLAEVKRVLRAFEHWADMTFCKLWKDAYFEEEVLVSLQKASADDLTERGFTLMAQSVLKQLNEAASTEVAGYTADTLMELLRYVGQSFSIEVEDF